MAKKNRRRVRSWSLTERKFTEINPDEFTEVRPEDLKALPLKGATLDLDEDQIKTFVGRLGLPRDVVEWLLLHRVMYYLPLGKADLLEAFKEIVADYVSAGEKTIELPTAVLVEILKVLNRKRVGKPPKPWDRKIDEWFALIGARFKLKHLKENGYDAVRALERVARELKGSPLFARNSLPTIKSRLHRRTFR